MLPVQIDLCWSRHSSWEGCFLADEGFGVCRVGGASNSKRKALNISWQF